MDANVIAGDRVPSWAATTLVGDALAYTEPGEIVFVMRRGDDFVLVTILPIDAFAPKVRALFDRRRHDRVLAHHRWVLAVDVDGTAALVEATGVHAPTGSA